MIIQHRWLEPLPSPPPEGGDGVHESQLGIDDAGAVAGRAGALGVSAEQRRLPPLAFANALRIRSSNPVYVAGLLRRDPLIAPWSIATTFCGDTEPWISELLPEPPRR